MCSVGRLRKASWKKWHLRQTVREVSDFNRWGWGGAGREADPGEGT